MATAKPIKDNAGTLSEFSATDTIPSSNLGMFSGQASIDFGAGNNDAVTVTINDSNIKTASVVILTITVPSSRDFDEMELEGFELSFGTIQNGVSFVVSATNITGGAEGLYQINYLIKN